MVVVYKTFLARMRLEWFSARRRCSASHAREWPMAVVLTLKYVDLRFLLAPGTQYLFLAIRFKNCSRTHPPKQVSSLVAPLYAILLSLLLFNACHRT